MKKVIFTTLMLTATVLCSHAERKTTITPMMEQPFLEIVNDSINTSVLQPASATPEVVNDSAKAKNPLMTFSAVQFSYMGGFSNFGKGYYGIGFEKIFDNNLIYSLSFHGSWGITDPGLYAIRLGIGYAYSPAPWFALVLKGTGFSGSYVSDAKVNSKGEIKYETEIGGGVLASPGIRLKAGRLVAGVDVDFGWAYYKGSNFYKDLMLSVGYCF